MGSRRPAGASEQKSHAVESRGHLGEDVPTPTQIPFPFSSEEDNPIKGCSIRELSVATINCAALAYNGTVWVWGWALGDEITRAEHMVKPFRLLVPPAFSPVRDRRRGAFLSCDSRANAFRSLDALCSIAA